MRLGVELGLELGEGSGLVGAGRQPATHERDSPYAAATSPGERPSTTTAVMTRRAFDTSERHAHASSGGGPRQSAMS
jgi:hypothetical protein